MQVFEYIAEVHRRNASHEQRSLKKLAEKAGIDRRTLHSLLRGRAHQCAALGRLARAAGISGEELLAALDAMELPRMRRQNECGGDVSHRTNISGTRRVR